MQRRVINPRCLRLPRPLFRPRHRASHSHPPPPPSTPPTPGPSFQNSLPSSTTRAFLTVRRTLTFSVAGLAALAFTTALAFETAHQYVEHVELAPESDPDGELARWGWTREAEHWSGYSAHEEGGGGGTGTDPALGWKARHAVRGAWIAQHWGARSAVITRAQLFDSGARALPANLELAHDFVSVALSIAFARQQQLRAQTIPELLVRRAAILERLGGRAFLLDARADYERVWSMLPRDGTQGNPKRAELQEDAARMAAKLGDVCARLGDGDEAIDWWGRAVSLLSPSPSTNSPDSTSRSGQLPSDESFLIPTSLPDTPSAQRTLASLLPALSAQYVRKGDLAQAKEVQVAGLHLLHEAGALPERSSSSAQALHRLFLSHRAALLTIHLAEVTYALHQQSTETAPGRRWLSSAKVADGQSDIDSFESLQRAAVMAENVAVALTSSTGKTTNAPAALSASFDSSRALRAPASSLLRDSRRAAVEAWTLAGVLAESSPSLPSPTPYSITAGLPTSLATRGNESKEETALACYERALTWAGAGSTDSAGTIDARGRGPGEGTLEEEWDALWRRYMRVREVVKAQEKDRVPAKSD